MTAAQKHTPSPWLAAAKPSSIVGWPIVGPGGRMIAHITLAPKPAGISDGEWSAYYVEVEANARLIGAAPELLAALTKMVDASQYDEPEKFLAALSESEAAIAKARLA